MFTALAPSPFPPPLVKVLLAQRFRDPAPVQAATWPLVMMGRDVLAVAKTRPALEAISRAFARREASKTYVALVAGDLSGAPRVVDAPLPDKRTGRDLAAVTEVSGEFPR